jgi:hypothetical protein
VASFVKRGAAVVGSAPAVVATWLTGGLEGVKKLTTARGCFWTGNAARLQA